MDRDTVAAAALQLSNLAFQIYDRANRGEISTEEALAIFKASSDRVQRAIEAFNTAG
jgi:Ca2+-binding EF-hand superfamily protein